MEAKKERRSFSDVLKRAFRSGSGRHDILPTVQGPTTAQAQSVASVPTTATITLPASATLSAAAAGPHLANPVDQSVTSFSNLSMSGNQHPSAPPGGSGGLPRPGITNNPLNSPMMVSSRSQSYTSRPGGDELLSPPGYSQTGQPPHNPYSIPQDHGRGASAGGLPGALQAGRNPSSSSATPSTVPVLPPISTQNPPGYGSSASRASGTSSHTYSRSSPAVGPHSDETKYGAQTPTHRTPAAQTPHHPPVYSPLGLADIRPRADSGAGEGPGREAPSYVDADAEPGNCQYLAPWPVYAFDWCKWPVAGHQTETAGKIAIGSYLEDSHNYLQVIDTHVVPNPNPDPEPDEGQHAIEFRKLAEATVSYPVTRILWEPESKQKASCDLLATSGDHLRLWSIPESKGRSAGSSINKSSHSHQGSDTTSRMTPLALLSNSKSPEHTAPLTSLDWNTISPSLIITSSIDTTCTIWDIPSLTAKTQLIAHDREVFDVRFCANSVDVFVSCGADGSVRMFDLRSLEHSTIIYEPSDKNDKSSSPGDVSPTKAHQALSLAPALLRLATSPHDTHLLSTISADSSVIRILDVRQPGQALLELAGHRASVNCMEWSPSRRGMLASGGDDSLVLVWDLMQQGVAVPSSVGGGPAGSLNGAGAGGLAPGAGAAAAGLAPGPEGAAAGTLRGPIASWTCDYEVNNVSWAPQSWLSKQGGDWLGVAGGRGVWGLSF